jgi:hypothetical protein
MYFTATVFALADCKSKESASPLDSLNVKSEGKRLSLRRTARFKLPVITSYSAAKSESRNYFLTPDYVDEAFHGMGRSEMFAGMSFLPWPYPWM